MRTDAGGLVGQGTRWILYLLASVLVMCLCSPACLVAAGNDVSAEIAVTPGSHNLAIPAIPDGSEVAEITVTITAATGWNLIRLDPAPAGWSGTYQRMYDGMSPGEAYGGVFTGELEPIEQLPPPKGSGGGKPDYTFTVNAEGTSIKPEYRIRPDEQTVCVGESATFYAEKKVDEASGWVLEESFWTVGGETNYPVASSISIVTNTPGEYSVVAANSPTRVLTDSATLTILKVDIEPTTLNVCSKTNSASLNLTTDSFLGGGTANWTSVPNGISGSGSIITFDPSSLTPTQYVVTAASSVLSGCTDTCIVEVIKVDIAPGSTNVCYTNTSVTLNLTGDSYLNGGTANWTSVPTGISGSGSSITFDPSSLTPTQYVVTAASSVLPGCNDTSTVTVVRVELNSISGENENGHAKVQGKITPSVTVDSWRTL